MESIQLEERLLVFLHQLLLFTILINRNGLIVLLIHMMIVVINF